MLARTRVATLAAFFVIACVAVLAAVDHAHAGMPSATLTPASASSNWLYVVSQAPRGDRLQRGDRVVIDDPQMLAAYQLHALPIGSYLHLRRLTSVARFTVAEPVVPNAGSRLTYPLLAIQLMFLCVAAIVAARSTASGSLSLAWLFALTVALVNPTAPAWPAVLVLVYAMFGGMLAAIAFACATDFAARFTGEGDAAWSRRVRFIAFIIALTAGILNVIVSTLSFTTPETAVWLQYSTIAALIVQSALFLTALAIAFVRTRQAERQKALWVVISLGVGIAGFLVTVLLGVAGVGEPLRDLPMALLIAMPLGCAYAMLRYRLLDIAFVANRATVFGVTSLLVLAALALVDFGLQSLLGSWLNRSGLFVQLGLALTIGIATRPIHGRVDRFVDDLFFRQRHEAERTLRQFVRDVAYIDDTGVVLRRTTETIANAGKLRCALFLRDERGFACAESSPHVRDGGNAKRNDGAVVRMLATHDTVDLHDVHTDVSGDFVFPMFARDRLLGFLVCSEKRDGVSAYAPDELEAIAAVAHAAGLAVDLLRIEALERELDALRRIPTGAAPPLGAVSS